ncbi:MAG: TspO/MBR family protein [Christensenellales bacterium]|jgi:benzodiazapine receptor
MAKIQIKDILKTVAAVLAVAVVGVAGTLLADTGSVWYEALVRPAFQPPDLVFLIVGIVLGAMIALSIARLIARGRLKAGLLSMFAANGLLNVIWSFAFFRMQSPVVAFAVLIALAVLTVLLLRKAWRADAAAGWLLVPYLAWLAFAAVINYVIAMLN